ncbi:hypothetical protein NXY00_17535 [Bacteroides sp. BFG-551]|nr:hypothetical protein [Bacteroides sp. BFG-551]
MSGTILADSADLRRYSATVIPACFARCSTFSNVAIVNLTVTALPNFSSAPLGGRPLVLALAIAIQLRVTKSATDRSGFPFAHQGQSKVFGMPER